MKRVRADYDRLEQPIWVGYTDGPKGGRYEWRAPREGDTPPDAAAPEWKFYRVVSSAKKRRPRRFCFDIHPDDVAMVRELVDALAAARRMEKGR